MNFALLGDDPVVLPLVRAIAAHPDHQLSHAALTTSTSQDILNSTPSVRLTAHWGEFLTADSIDAVIVAGTEHAVLEGAKQIAAAGRPLIVFPQVEQGAAWVYELSLIRDETRTLLCPIFPRPIEPLLQELRKNVADGTIGALLHLQWERELKVDAIPEKPPLLSQPIVDALLLPDIDLLRNLGGEYSRVTSLRAGQTADGFALATVTLAGEKTPEASWSLKSTTSASTWKLTLTGEKGTLVTDHAQPIPADFDESTALLKSIETAIHTQTAKPSWADLARDFELIEAVHRSIRRSRTIDVHFETPSERGVFKTQMTAFGCGLLSVTLVAVVLVLVVGPVFDPRNHLEADADRNRSIIYQDDFVKGSPQLTSEGSERLADIAKRMKKRPFPILIEQSHNPNRADLDNIREETILRALGKVNIPNANQFVTMDALKGKLFSPLMRVARLVVFLPLGLFLVLQLLLFFARPTSSTSTASDEKTQ